MMKDENILNSILEWHIENQYKDGLLDPELVAKKLNIKIDSKTAYLMCAMMRDDGYLYKVKDNHRVYFANYRAKIFLKEGGYRQVFKIAKRKKELFGFQTILTYSLSRLP